MGNISLPRVMMTLLLRYGKLSLADVLVCIPQIMAQLRLFNGHQMGNISLPMLAIEFSRYGFPLLEYEIIILQTQRIYLPGLLIAIILHLDVKVLFIYEMQPQDMKK